MKIAYFGYDFFYSCLEMLVQEGHEVVKVFSYETDNHYNFRANVERIAKNIGAQLQVEKVSKQDIIKLHEDGCDLLVVAAYPYKVPVLKDYPIPGLNIHPTLLPEGRGPWPLPYVILNGLKNSGITIHKLTEKMDAGDILIQKEFSVIGNDNLETLSFKCQVAAVKALQELVQDIDRLWDRATIQGEGSYWPMPPEELMKLDWNQSVEEIDRVARAFGKFDSCAEFDNQSWVVQDLTTWVESHNYNCGEVAHRTNKEVIIAAKDGFVCLRFFGLDPDYS
jgi:methionyl-tRNA formyltransferase